MVDVRTSDKKVMHWFCELVDQYQAVLLRTCYVILKDYALAEDAVQETFMKAYQARNSFRRDCSEKTWLMRIAMNTCKDMKRKAWFRRVDRCITPDQIPEASVPFEEKDDSIIQSIMQLPYREKEVVLLHFYQNMTQQEISLSLGLSVSTISTRLTRAKKKLKAVLEESDDDE